MNVFKIMKKDNDELEEVFGEFPDDSDFGIETPRSEIILDKIDNPEDVIAKINRCLMQYGLRIEEDTTDYYLNNLKYYIEEL